jgi:hypothetical protein
MNGFHLKPARDEPTLIRKNGVLVHHGTDTVDIDIITYINADRDHRTDELAVERPQE